MSGGFLAACENQIGIGMPGILDKLNEGRNIAVRNNFGMVDQRVGVVFLVILELPRRAVPALDEYGAWPGNAVECTHAGNLALRHIIHAFVTVTGEEEPSQQEHTRCDDGESLPTRKPG